MIRTINFIDLNFTTEILAITTKGYGEDFIAAFI